MTAVLYVHGKGGSADEAEHYRPLFPAHDVLGLEYEGVLPWETCWKIESAVQVMKEHYDHVLLIANSIGAFFSMHASIERYLDRAWFVSPVVDMEKLILDMMIWAGVTEAELQNKGTIPTAFGETLSWEYLNWVRTHPLRWSVPTEILYGSNDELTSMQTVQAFAASHPARLTVMDGGEHWFHTPEQMAFLDDWILRTRGKEE